MSISNTVVLVCHKW